MSFKKGAMFGLDARIALAIFGALSVISGAALFSAIEQSKVTQIVTQLREVEKAIEQYYLDVGEQLPLLTVNKFDVIDLIEDNGKAGWNGPYLSFEHDSSSRIKFLNSTGSVSLWESGEWGLDTPTTPGGDLACDVGDECFVWVSYYSAPTELAQAVDLSVDGISDPKNGNIRLYETGATQHIWLKTNMSYKL